MVNLDAEVQVSYLIFRQGGSYDIGENEIKVTYYFNSKQYAKYFFYNFNRSKQQGRAKENHKLFLNNLKTAYEIPNYGRNWNLYDPDGKDISEYIK